ncbi:histidine phosphatase family protein [Ancylobacter sp. 6x-1]|uniref:Histidine phosphatase family protein n=1 Tax=Ancylobacter crimeensis TaxID=2579147 RepID=A0ABT0D6K0_9HYPH|nr:histidine phosphatase family protein [Ancylobacter crimeensis]MCK0195568.1 histidine phosphatase family protein [Ancylobacter crimeensis]
MQLLLIRHGNTFEPGETSRWVGARTDLPLTTEGRAQAARLGARLREAGLAPSAIVHGPMLRHRQSAEELASALGHPANTLLRDERLQEIDYGTWEDRSNAEIASFVPEAVLAAWSRDGVWPAVAGWATREADFLATLRGVLADIAARAGEGERIALVTSGGTIRSLYRAAGFDAEGADTRARTGSASALTRLGDDWRLDFWNRRPDDL